MRTVTTSRRVLKWVGNSLLVVMMVWTLVPFYWMIVTSFKGSDGKEFFVPKLGN